MKKGLASIAVTEKNNYCILVDFIHKITAILLTE